MCKYRENSCGKRKGSGQRKLFRTRALCSSLDIVFATSALSESLGRTNTVIPSHSRTFTNTQLCTTATVYSRGGGVLPYMGHIDMCRCGGYGFQAGYSRIGYINQSVWVSNRLSFFRKLISRLKISSTLGIVV